MTLYSHSGSFASFPLVRLDNVTVTMQGVTAVDGVSLTIHQGRHLLLQGPNGAGKTTLLRLLRGETRPDQAAGGRVIWYEDGEESLSPLSGRSLCAIISPHLHNMYMGQSWDLTGEEMIIAGLTDDYFLYHRPTPAQRESARSLAEKLGGEKLLPQKLGTYSQGQLRLVLLMRALARKPRILLLDEAVDGLDNEACHAFTSALEELVTKSGPNAPSEWSPTIIMSTHRPPPPFLKEYIAMDRGRLSGPHFLAEKNLPEDSAPAKRATRVIMAQAALSPAPSSAVPTGLGITLKDATVFLDRVEVLHGINWQIAPGENWAVLGHNGSGKSTLLRTLMSLEDIAWGGEMRRTLDGEPLVLLEEVNRHMRMVSDRLQALYSYDDTARQVVFTGFDGSIGVYREPTEAENLAVDSLLELTGMMPWQDRSFHSLSTGQARRILLARALAGKPRLLLLDEPFSGLDAESRAAMLSILEQKANEGLQLILTSHHKADIPPCIQKIAHLKEGRLTSP